MPTYEPMLDSSAAPWDGGPADELRLIAGLRAGDEDVFLELVDLYHHTLVRMAMHLVPSRVVAEDVAVEAWSRFVTCVDRIEGRFSVRTWLFRTLICCARHRCADNAPGDIPAVSHRSPDPPRPWGTDALERLASADGRELVGTTLAGLPREQREVVALRDVSGLTATEVGEILGFTEPEQRALLHRGRITIRNELHDYLQR
jgi:RNA polymerase sigma-70 factor (ECF subfamily)